MPCRLLLASFLVLLAGAGDRAVAASLSEEDLLVLQIHLGERLLADDLLAYVHPDGVFLPLARLVELLELPIAVDPESGSATGSLSRTFEPPLARAHEGDLFVDRQLLSSWLPIEFDVDTAALVLRLSPREKLPVQERWERETRRREAESARSAASGSVSGPRFAVQAHPYGFLDWPVLDGQASFSFGRDGEGRQAGVLRSSLLAQGDLLAMTAALFVSGEVGGGAEPPVDARLVLERRDPEGRLLGAAGATELRVGDVAVSLDPLLSPGRSGRGFEIARSAGSLTRPEGSHRTSLSGDALPGWEVELYRDGTLLGFQVVGENGRYEFKDVPLRGGSNLLRLAFYGPQGQRRESEERFFVGSGLAPGATAWRLGVQQQDVGLLRSPELAASEAAEGAELRGELRASFEMERGLSRRLSLSGGLASLELADGRHDYLSLGLGTSLPGGSGQLRLTGDLRGGWTGRLGIQGRLGPLHAAVEHSVMQGFRSEVKENDGLRSRSQARLEAQLRIPGLPSLPPLPFSVTATREQRAEHEHLSVQATSALSLPLGRAAFSSRWRLGFSQGELTAGGGLHLNGRFRGFGVRGNLGYQLAPEPDLSDLAINGETELRPGLSVRFGLSQGLRRPNTAISGGLDWRREALVLGMTAGLSSDGRAEVGGSVSFSLGREPHTERPRMLPAGASQGAVSARVFLDADADGRFSKGDSPLAGIRFKADGNLLHAATGADGVAWLRLSPYGRVDLSLAEETLPDPAWVAEREGVGLRPRPGAVWDLDFPVIATGEIDGTVFLRRGDSKQEASNVLLQLIGADGTVVQEAKSQYDGFYLFEKVRPGRYTLRVAPGQLERLRLTATPERSEIDLGGGEIRSGMDILLAPVPGLSDSRAAGDLRVSRFSPAPRG